MLEVETWTSAGACDQFLPNPTDKWCKGLGRRSNPTVVARVDVPILLGQRWWSVSLEALSPHLWYSSNSSGGTVKVRLLEWLGGTMTLPTAKQTVKYQY